MIIFVINKLIIVNNIQKEFAKNVFKILNLNMMADFVYIQVDEKIRNISKDQKNIIDLYIF